VFDEVDWTIRAFAVLLLFDVLLAFAEPEHSIVGNLPVALIPSHMLRRSLVFMYMPYSMVFCVSTGRQALIQVIEFVRMLHQQCALFIVARIVYCDDR